MKIRNLKNEYIKAKNTERLARFIVIFGNRPENDNPENLARKTREAKNKNSNCV